MKVDIHYGNITYQLHSSKYIHKRKENIHPQDDSHANLHNDFIIIVPRVGAGNEKTQLFYLGEWLNKL